MEKEEEADRKEDGKTILRSGLWTWMDFASSTKAAEVRTRLVGWLFWV